MSLTVWCTTHFDSVHRWKQAPEQVYFLRTPHHHRFHVRLEVLVGDEHRDVEFIMLSKWVDGVIETRLSQASSETLEWSCESWALFIKDRAIECGMSPMSVSVSEEGIHGASWHRQ